MTVRKLIAYGRYPHQRRFIGWTDKDEQAVTEALEATRLVDKAERPLHALSGGERQRVWLALALAQQTDVLLLDEPTTYLDLYNQYETLMLVRSLNQTYQKTIVMVLHDLNQALQYSDEVIIMKHGCIVAAGDPRDIMTESLVKDVFQVRSIIREDAEAGLLFMPIGV
ncbi:ABC transporter ATP-binding protein [Bacillus sp. JCM 19041]|uniref:ABC transporter ATP-binding protein n=1 Tax=Bacillus sp. JCM 19041 TaxID=1460637 RepID=UPI000AC46D13